jgi:hypothetical protein
LILKKTIPENAVFAKLFILRGFLLLFSTEMLYYISYSLFGQTYLCCMRMNRSFKVISVVCNLMD